MKNILVTGIGGGVGQGILRNIRSLQLDIAITGTNVDAVSAGNYLCDMVYKVPYAFEASFIDTIKNIIAERKIDLVIPSTDYEAFYLAKFRGEFPCPVACSPEEVTGMCLDKYINYRQFSHYGIPFAQSILPSEYKNEFENYVVKPREGRGSRGIHLNVEEPSKFEDSYIIQEFLDGPEITTGVYITKEGKLHGSITLLRELEAGATSKCEVVTIYDEGITALVSSILDHFKFLGSFNIQSRVTSKGIIPFEINCRISGTNSIRSQFGFKDVMYTLQEYLFHEQPEKITIQQGAALRIMLDIIYPGATLATIESSKNNYIF